jgi:hypothetical protein
MSFPQVSFQVRTRSVASPTDIGQRVGNVLGCRFEPSSDRMFEPGEALEAFALGLQITIRHDPEIPEDLPRTYMVMGMLRGDVEARWEPDAPTISISQYVLGLMTACDGAEWYVPSLEEQLQEAGIEAE